MAPREGWEAFVPFDKEAEKTKENFPDFYTHKSIELRWFCCHLHQGRSSLLSSCPEINGINQLTSCFSCVLIFWFFFPFYTGSTDILSAQAADT